jgi:hypothetical protein
MVYKVINYMIDRFFIDTSKSEKWVTDSSINDLIHQFILLRKARNKKTCMIETKKAHEKS